MHTDNGAVQGCTGPRKRGKGSFLLFLLSAPQRFRFLRGGAKEWAAACGEGLRSGPSDSSAACGES